MPANNTRAAAIPVIAVRFENPFALGLQQDFCLMLVHGILLHRKAKGPLWQAGLRKTVAFGRHQNNAMERLSNATPY